MCNLIKYFHNSIVQSGHSIASQQGWEIDCKYLRHMRYEEEQNRLRCGPGCHWSHLIQLLNAHGKSPRTMQSYCSFSVGGTLAVNAHGITTDYCFAESVLEFRLVRLTSSAEAKVVVCRPKSTLKGKEQKKKSSLSSDLFSLALGGYGLFGVITEVLLKVEDNYKLELNTMHLKVQPSDDVHEESQVALVIVLDIVHSRLVSVPWLGRRLVSSSRGRHAQRSGTARWRRQRTWDCR